MVSISACKFILPSVSNLEELKLSVLNKKNNIEFEPVKLLNNKIIGYKSTNYIDKHHKFYPPRSEEKIMREDVLAATLCIQELMEESKITEEEASETALFIANGAFIGNLFDQDSRLVKYLRKALAEKDTTIRRQKIFKVLPPLMALYTLTNASESYTAQFSGISGQNATFGTSSINGFYALQEGVEKILNGEVKTVVVGASNVADFSSFMLQHKFAPKDKLKQSSGAIFLLLEKEENAIKNNRNILGKISSIKHTQRVPTLFSEINKNEDIEFTPMSDTLIYSNYTFSTKECYKKWKNVYTLDNILGHTGALSVFLDIASALSLLNDKTSVDCIDTDYFARSSFVQITKK